MIVLSEKALRRIIREELERILAPTEENQHDIVVHSPTGADVIFPNAVREGFDNGEINSIGDIIT